MLGLCAAEAARHDRGPGGRAMPESSKTRAMMGRRGNVPENCGSLKDTFLIRRHIIGARFDDAIDQPAWIAVRADPKGQEPLNVEDFRNTLFRCLVHPPSPTPILALAPSAAPRSTPPHHARGGSEPALRKPGGMLNRPIPILSAGPALKTSGQSPIMRIENDVKARLRTCSSAQAVRRLNSRNEVDIARSFRFYTRAGRKVFADAAHMDVTGTMAMARVWDATAQSPRFINTISDHPPSSLRAMRGAHAFFRSARPPRSRETGAVRKRAQVAFSDHDGAKAIRKKFLETVKSVRDVKQRRRDGWQRRDRRMTEALILAART